MGCAVQAFEERKVRGVGRSGLDNGRKLLDDDVRVPLNLALGVQELGRRKVILIGINEEASLHITDGHLNGKSGVGLESSKVFGVDKLG